MMTHRGFAIRRNGSCLTGIETDCGGTVGNFRGCCPNGFMCPHAYNIDCCATDKNCTAAIVAKPVCANSTWDLYDNRGFYFCCERGLPGFNRDDASLCVSPGSSPNGESLPLVSTADPASSAASSTSSAPRSTTSSKEGSSTPVGAIAGGVVGGVVGLAILALVAWLIMRRKRQSKTENLYSTVHKADKHSNQDTTELHQLDDTQRIHEAGAGKVTYVQAHTEPVELPAEQQRVA